MNDFYTYATLVGTTLQYRGYNHSGKRFNRKEKFKPRAWFKSDDPGLDWKTITGETLAWKQFDSTFALSDFTKENRDIYDEFYFFRRHQYQALAEKYGSDEFDPKIEMVRVGYIDIEVSIVRPDGKIGFPSVADAIQEINAIAITFNGDTYQWGFGERLVPDRELPGKLIYHPCDDEEDLLRKFLDGWQSLDLDVASGWNCETFDFPYLVNRMINVIGEDDTQALSPFRDVKTREFKNAFGDQISAEISGISILDYLPLYKKLIPGSKESYKLDFISQLEIGKAKKEYDGTLLDFYNKDYTGYLEYNAIDAARVWEINKKLKLMELAITLGWQNRCNFEDIFSQVRMWESYISNYLYQRKMIVPDKMFKNASAEVIGAYVKEPIPGLYDWVVSFDLDSLYPNMKRVFNISPETFIHEKAEKRRILKEMIAAADEVIQKKVLECVLAGQAPDIDLVVENKTALVPKAMRDKYIMSYNGTLFKKDVDGIFPIIVRDLYFRRKEAKKKMLEADKFIEKINQELKSRGISEKE